MTRSTERARAKVLDAWEVPDDAGEPIAAVASSFTFDADFFEEELITRFLGMESSPDDDVPYRAEREWRLGKVPVAALVDARHVDERTTLAWDLLPVRVRHGCCQHAKVSLLAWEHRIRLIVASANLTSAGYRRNLETFAMFDFEPGGEVPRSVVDDTLHFLRRVLASVPRPSDREHGPTARASALLDAIEARAKALALPDEWPRGSVRAKPVFLAPGPGPGVIEQLDSVWGAGARPSGIWLCSPFWGEPGADGCDPVVEAMATQMSKRGENGIDILAAGATEVPEGSRAKSRWVAYAPDSILKTRAPRTEVRVWPVAAQHDDEERPLHAKLVRWFAESGADILMSGSSNATAAGMGVGNHVRNFEANVAYVSDRTSATIEWFNACFPPHHDEPTDHLKPWPTDRLADLEEDGPVPVPEFFAWASAASGDTGGTLVVGFDPAAPEPPEWSLELVGEVGDRCAYDRVKHLESGRPPTWTLSLPQGKPLPSQITVHWQAGDAQHRGLLPVNAQDAASRCDHEAFHEVDLDTLIHTLGDPVPIHRALARRRRNRDGGKAGPSDHELDPHRRVDISNFLVPRMRRISRALEGLHDRLVAPIHSATSLEWRFVGPFAPLAVAKTLATATTDPAEQAFLLVEVLATVARARRRVTVDKLLRKTAHASFDNALRDIRARVPPLEPSAASAYVSRALAHHEVPDLLIAQEPRT